MLEILKMFEPLLKNCFWQLKYDEDLKQEIIYKMIKLIKIEIVFEKLRIVDDRVLVTYIGKAVRNYCIYLSKMRKSNIYYEFSEEIMSDIAGDRNINDDFIITDLLKSILTEKELLCFNLTEILGYTSEEAAKFLGITKQACNQSKLRAIKKLRNYYETHEVCENRK